MWSGYIQQIYAALSGLFSGAAAQTWTPITPSATLFAAQVPPVVFRALRFDVAGTVTFTNQAGTSLVRNVVAGEQWSASSAAITAITAAGATGIDGLG